MQLRFNLGTHLSNTFWWPETIAFALKIVSVPFMLQLIIRLLLQYINLKWQIPNKERARHTATIVRCILQL
jgi:hypothetical protein